MLQDSKQNEKQQTGRTDDVEDPLLNVRFDDDVLLFAPSSSDAGKMIAQLGAEAAKYGLKLYLGKNNSLQSRKVSTWARRWGKKLVRYLVQRRWRNT